MFYKAVNVGEIKADLDRRTFEGYASTFGNVDLVGDVVVRGAFSKTLKERGDRVKVLWQHDAPLGKPTEMHEDSEGLWVKGKVSKTRLGDEALELMRDGVVDSMSIGYAPLKSDPDPDRKGVTLLKEVKLYEFSPVTFPANESARIAGVKALAGRLTDLVAAVRAGDIEQDAVTELAEQLQKVAAALAPQHEPDLSTHDAGEPHIDTQSEPDADVRALHSLLAEVKEYHARL
ncbi:MAG: HK97 family phage prohead protease [Desulfuromonadales bacterium]|nr:HK97 family phage prohead protease [Desulfuromonadales bacterium]